MNLESLGRLLLTIVKGLATRPDDVSVSCTQTDTAMVYFVKAHIDDVGRFLGRNGCTAASVRHVLRHVSAVNLLGPILIDFTPTESGQNEVISDIQPLSPDLSI